MLDDLGIELIRLIIGDADVSRGRDVEAYERTHRAANHFAGILRQMAHGGGWLQPAGFGNDPSAFDDVDREVADSLQRARRDRDEKRFAEAAVEIHQRLFACTGFPRLQKLIGIVLGPVGLRYDRIIVYPFDDAWDVLTEMSVRRYELIRERDADAVIEGIRHYRAIMHTMGMERVQRPEILRYFRD